MKRNKLRKLVLSKETLLSLDMMRAARGAAASDAEECAKRARETTYCPSRDALCWWTDGCIIRV